MIDWYFLLAPVAVLAVLLLFHFIGCNFGGPPGGYETFARNNAVAYIRLREKPGDTVAKNEIGAPDGTFGTAPAPLEAGEPTWLSTRVDVPGFDLGVTDPRLLQTDSSSSAIRVDGGFVQVPANVPPLDNLTEFTLEVLVHPEWDVVFKRGKYYCVLESADFITMPGLPPPVQKNAGFGIYAGPETLDPTSPYVWQFWMGVGSGFRPSSPKPFTPVPKNPVPNPGPIVRPEPTYLAVTFSKSQQLAFLYVYTPEHHDMDYTTYELFPLTSYVPASKDLFIGIAPEGPLFPPPSGSPVTLYPFKGLIGEVAIYDKVLTESQLRNHVIDAFHNI